MKRLRIPKSPLKGQPLTIDEMKEITGGLAYYRNCSCKFIYNDGTSAEQYLQLASGQTCSAQCAELCSKPHCVEYHYFFAEGD